MVSIDTAWKRTDINGTVKWTLGEPLKWYGEITLRRDGIFETYAFMRMGDYFGDMSSGSRNLEDAQADIERFLGLRERKV